MKVQRLGLLGALVLVGVLALGLLLGWLGGQPVAAHGRPDLSSSIHYVAPGAACGGAVPCYGGLQAAVDAAGPGDEIRVAAGSYTDLHARAGLTQVVYLSETVTIRGGYVPPDWETSDPLANPTELDAGGGGRGMVIAGGVAPEIDGLQITGGDAAGLGGDQGPFDRDVGGGIYVAEADPVFGRLTVYSNTAQEGGGLYIWGSQAALRDSAVLSNTAEWLGGGLSLINSTADVDSNTVAGNSIYGIYGAGGGVYLRVGDYTLGDNEIRGNESTQVGGGLLQEGSATVIRLLGNRFVDNRSGWSVGGGAFIGYGEALLIGNTFVGNWARYDAGGLMLAYNVEATLAANMFSGNTAGRDGGGLVVRLCQARLVNTVVVDNQAGRDGSGLLVEGATARLWHTTLADNTGGAGSAVAVIDREWGSLYTGTLGLTNTVVATQAVGVSVAGGNLARIDHMLWHSTPLTVSASPTATVLVGQAWTGDAALAADGYHLTYDSAARDKALGSAVVDDVDGDSRLFAAPPDLGADEYACFVRLDGVDYPSVQAAVDASAAPDDLVQIAGTCRGVELRGGRWQVGRVDRSLTLRGGYNAGFTLWKPASYPATLDAAAGGRVLYLTGLGQPGGITVTVEALSLVNGVATQSGGGLYAEAANLTLTDCVVAHSSAGLGGGGIYFSGCPAAMVTNCSIYGNEGSMGGGLALVNSDGARLVNTLLVENQATGAGQGAGLYSHGSDTTLLHATVAANRGGGGQGLSLANQSTLTGVNTILVGHGVGVQVSANSAAALTATLWGTGTWANGADWLAAGTLLTGTINLWELPAFVTIPWLGDYRIAATSAARDAGVEAGVTVDLDGELRPYGAAPDLGADEYRPGGWLLLPLVRRN